MTALATSRSASAFDFLGVHLFDDGQTATTPDQQTYTITFEVNGGDDKLKDTVRGASNLWTDRNGKPPVSSTVFIENANAEYAQIVAALRAAGYFGGTVAIKVNNQLVETLKPAAPLPKPVAIDISVTAGPLFQFGAITIANRPPAEPDQDPRTTTPEGLGLVTAKVALSEAILKSEVALRESWERQGHPKATVLPRDLVANHATNVLDVHIGVNPGPAATFGPVAVTGTQKMDREFVARQTALPEGQPWDKDKVSEAEARLRRLQVFSSARVVQDKTIAPNGELGVTTEVAERPLYSVGANASYSTLDGPGVGGFWEDHDLWGRAERLRLDAQLADSASNTFNPRSLTYLLGPTLVIPGVIDPYTDFTAQAIYEQQSYITFTQQTARVRVGLIHDFSPQLTGTIDLNSEFDHVVDGYGKRDLNFNSLPANLTFDASDNKLEPTKGFRIKLDAEPFYESKFNNAGVILHPQGSTYISLDADSRYILAGHVEVGSIFGAPAYQLPADRLFFAGGGNSVRGYRYLSLGPQNAAGVVEGGRSLFETSLEFRAKVTDTIGVVPFVDAGNAFASNVPDFKTPLKVGAGMGLRYYTGLGAIRLDVALPVNRSPGDPRYGIYLGLGESF
jgi:translocation and assembly module TamA